MQMEPEHIEGTLALFSSIPDSMHSLSLRAQLLVNYYDECTPERDRERQREAEGHQEQGR